MQPNKILVIFLFLIARIFAAGILQQFAEPNGALEIDKAAVNVLLTCYKNRGNAVGLVGNVSDVVIKSLSSERVPTVLINDLMLVDDQNSWAKHLRPRYKLKVFVIAVESHTDLETLRINTYSTIWWNNQASFLILYRSPHGCNDADYALFESWNFAFFHAKLICFDHLFGTRVLSYNLYGIVAPKPWRLRGMWPINDAGIKWKSFMTFERSYNNGNEICKNLDVDNFKNVNGYPVEIMFMYYSYREDNFDYSGLNDLINITQKAGTKNNNDEQPTHSATQSRKNGSSVKTYGSLLIDLFVTTIRAMNGTPYRRIVTHDDSDRVLKYFHDLVHSASPLASQLGNPEGTSRIFGELDMVFLTHHRGFKTQLQKIFSVVDLYSNIAVGSSVIVIFIFFKFFASQPTIHAILNIVRLVCNTGFTNIPQDTPSRLFLTGVLLFVVTMQGIYQGNLASLLTNEQSLPNVDTRQDLMESDHEIYVQRGFHRFLTDDFEERLTILQGHHDCMVHVLHNLSTACVAHFDDAIRAPHYVYVSKPFLSTLSVLNYRQNWPLAESFNIIIGKLFEADLIASFEYRVNHMTLADFLLSQELRYTQDFRNMTLRDLGFAFVILGIGLTCASVTFVVEVAIHRISARPRIKRVMVIPFSPPT